MLDIVVGAADSGVKEDYSCVPYSLVLFFSLPNILSCWATIIAELYFALCYLVVDISALGETRWRIIVFREYLMLVELTDEGMRMCKGVLVFFFSCINYYWMGICKEGNISKAPFLLFWHLLKVHHLASTLYFLPEEAMHIKASNQLLKHGQCIA